MPRTTAKEDSLNNSLRRNIGALRRWWREENVEEMKQRVRPEAVLDAIEEFEEV